LTFSRVRIRAEDAPRALASLYRAGFSGGHEEEEGTLSWFIAAFSRPEAARLAVEMLEQEGIACRLEENVVAGDPTGAFRGGLRPFRAGRFWIDPRESSSGHAPPEAIALRIPARMAFGTGLHESTRGILAMLESMDLAGWRALDVGCGSGILAIAAVKCGAARTVGLDRDLDAVFEARRNVLLNRVSGKLALFAGGVGCLDSRFDLVLANLIWEELEPLLPSLDRLLSESGTALFSGILDEHLEQAVAVIEDFGLKVFEIASDGEWRTLRSQKCPGHP
jgi:ribosomal protein L11 methyltransferase